MNTKIQEVFKKEWNIGFLEKIMQIIRSFSLTEKTLFVLFSILFIFSGLSLLYKVNESLLVEIPDYGGSLTEGIIGSPRFINPILASSDIDRDLTSVLYSGLMKIEPDGTLKTDIAESYTISEDGLSYTFKIKDDVYFHDGTRLTADDVVFTIEKAQDPLLKSPREASFSGVRVEKLDESTVLFSLRQAYSPFIYTTTIGILPRHLWKDVSIEEFPFSKWNTEPIGTGPYKIESISYTNTGLPKVYKLVAFNRYSLGRPYIKNLIIKSYQNERELVNAYQKKDIESLYGISPRQILDLNIKKENIILSDLPRTFGVFFNQNIAGVFVFKEVRQALEVSANKQAIVNEILNGYGKTIDGPVPKQSTEFLVSTSTTIVEDMDNIERAKEILTKAGWTQDDSGIFTKKDRTSTNRLSFSISTANVPELKETAVLLQRQWQMIGAEVEVKVFEITDLNQNVIRPRKYDALLFGTITGREMDFYPFWHSSGRNSPGLNIAMYTNSRVDRILDDLRKTNGPETQKTYLENLEKEIKNDIPAIFTHSPYFIYITPTKINNVKLGLLGTPAERFTGIEKWYIETSKVWKIFNRN